MIKKLFFFLTLMSIYFNSFCQKDIDIYKSINDLIDLKYQNMYQAESIKEGLVHVDECRHLLINVSIDKNDAPIALSSGLGELENLIKISVQCNKRIVFPKEIGNLINLEAIDVVSSPLSDGDVPLAIRKCENLKIVILNGDNKFSVIPQGLLEINSLQFLIVKMGESVDTELLKKQLLDLTGRENKTYIIIKDWDKHAFVKMKIKRDLKSKNIAISFT